MTSILERKYVDIDRPISHNELLKWRVSLHRSLRLGKCTAHHERCDHFYLVKVNSRKEKEMIAQNSLDVGNCSVCWKIKKAPSYLRDRARDTSNEYFRTFYLKTTIPSDTSETDMLTYNCVDLEAVFYTWLYAE
jgi:hypothetical protein